MKLFLLGIDIGTSACKVALYDTDGRIVAQSSKSCQVYYPAPGYVEQNPEEWWDKVCAGIKEIMLPGKPRNKAGRPEA